MSNDEVIATLNPTAAMIAGAFLAQHPDAVLTSGRRDIPDQAEAMAANTVLNRNWIRETYLSSPLSVACQNHVNQCGPWLTQEELASGFRDIMCDAPPEELRKLSWHLSRDAFDVHVDGDPLKAITLQDLLAAAVKNGATGKFLMKEGGLVRWHLQACS